MDQHKIIQCMIQLLLKYPVICRKQRTIQEFDSSYKYGNRVSQKLEIVKLNQVT